MVSLGSRASSRVELLRDRNERGALRVEDLDYNRHGRIADEVAAQFFPSDPPQFYRVPSSYNKIDPIKDALCDAGFIDLRIAVLTREKQVSDIGAFAHAMVYGNPLIDMIRTRGGVDPDQVVNALGEALAREFGDPALLPLQAILLEATRP